VPKFRFALIVEHEDNAFLGPRHRETLGAASSSMLASLRMKSVIGEVGAISKLASSPVGHFKAMLIKVHRCRFSNVIRR
jgi:hypothetical protein